MNDEYIKPWMKIDTDTKALDLYYFLNDEIPFKEVIELYRLLKYKMDYHVDMVQNREYCSGMDIED